MLAERGRVRVALTRDDDRYLTLDQRAESPGGWRERCSCRSTSTARRIRWRAGRPSIPCPTSLRTPKPRAWLRGRIAAGGSAVERDGRIGRGDAVGPCPSRADERVGVACRADGPQVGRPFPLRPEPHRFADFRVLRRAEVPRCCSRRATSAMSRTRLCCSSRSSAATSSSRWRRLSKPTSLSRTSANALSALASSAARRLRPHAFRTSHRLLALPLPDLVAFNRARSRPGRPWFAAPLGALARPGRCRRPVPAVRRHVGLFRNRTARPRKRCSPISRRLPTNVRGYDGKPVQTFARERRVELAYDEYPPLVVQAFISAEDKTFFSMAASTIRA